MTARLSVTGIGTTKPGKLNTKHFLSCVLLDAWYSIFCQKDFIESGITDCTETYGIKK